MTKKIILELLHLQQQIRLYHWNTKNYGRHVASGTFYDTLTPLLDSYVETYQGLYPRVNMEYKLRYGKQTDQSILKYLKQKKNKLTSYATKLKERELIMILDEIIKSVSELLYVFSLVS